MSDTAANHHPQERGAWLEAHRENLRHERRGLLRTESGWSWARLVTFFAAVSVWYPLADELLLAAVSTGILFGLFGLSVRRHHLVRDRRRLTDRVLEMVDESLKRCGGTVIAIRPGERPKDASIATAKLSPVVDDGPTWMLTEQERDDLDLYALPAGLFGLLNRSSTVLGARRLRDVVERPSVSIDHIRSHQEAVRWLEENPAQRLRVMGAAAVLRNQDLALEGLASALSSATPLPRPILCIVLRIWSVVTAAITVAAVVQLAIRYEDWVLVVVALLLINGAAFDVVRKTLKKRLAPWKGLQNAANGYLHAAAVTAEELPTSTNLQRLRDCLAAAASPTVLPALCRRVGWADAGGMMHAFFNAYLFYDLHVTTRILHSVLPNRTALLNGLGALADLEVFTSLASFAYETGAGGGTCYPTMVTQQRLSIVGGRHPLISPGRVVPNDIQLDAATRMYVVTGSNMAGKSTLLRMCGVNCLLAQIGSVALAEEMTLSPVWLMTDLLARDNLGEDESYFLAEVRHIRRMVVPDVSTGTILGLIDEPFRGTNSTEQQAASLAVLEHMAGASNFFIVATHEQVLTEFAERCEIAKNHHFREDLEAAGLVFDYRLQPGPATTRNALRVLEKEGYPPALLANALKWLERGK
ncbi:MAG: MutS-related protein [Planctomycetota bacterium]|jgi:hypothetical protein